VTIFSGSQREPSIEHFQESYYPRRLKTDPTYCV